MSGPREGSREIDEGIIVSEAMDWCNSPTEPVPYRLWARQTDATNLANSVRQTDDRSHVKNSLVLASYGDEPGVGGGVISGTTGAECTPKTWSDTVRAEGRNIVRHDDEWWMNHKNTCGLLSFKRDQQSYPTPTQKSIDPLLDFKKRLDDLPPGSETYLAQSTVAAPVAGAGGAVAGDGGAALLRGGAAVLEAAPPVAAGTAIVVGGGAIAGGAGYLVGVAHNAHMTILEGPNLSAPGPPTIDQIDKAYAKNQAQALAKAQVKPISWVRITANPCYQYACPPSVGPYKGGTYLCTKGGNTEGHHTPAASVSYLPYSAGPSIQMDPADHALTASHGSSALSATYRAAQSSAISSGNFMGAVNMDVADVQSKFPGKYNSAIVQMLAYANCLKTNGFVR